MGKTIAIASRKGGVGKTTTAISLAAGFVKQGKRVLALDLDPQGSLTTSFGIREPDSLSATVGAVMSNIINDSGFDKTVIKHSEGADVLPANNSLSGVELELVQAMSRESVLRQNIN
jgi:chromosome partitioning protein